MPSHKRTQWTPHTHMPALSSKPFYSCVDSLKQEDTPSHTHTHTNSEQSHIRRFQTVTTNHWLTETCLLHYILSLWLYSDPAGLYILIMCSVFSLHRGGTGSSAAVRGLLKWEPSKLYGLCLPTAFEITHLALSFKRADVCHFCAASVTEWSCIQNATDFLNLSAIGWTNRYSCPKIYT